MAEESDLERTEPASGRRLEQAREEGQVPQSRELAAFLVLLASVSGFWTMGGWLSRHAAVIMRRGLSFGRDAAFDSHAMGNAFMAVSWQALMLAAPLFLLCIVAAIATPFLMGGAVFSPKGLALDFSRLDPLAGLGRIFSVQGVAEMVKAILKALLVGAVTYWVVVHQVGTLFALFSQSLDTGLQSFVKLLLLSAVAMVVGVGLIAGIDVPFQLWQYYSKLRMTKEELRQESKESEGDPQVKARIRRQQREMVKKRMMSEVPTADVVVTNPSHYAVALKYDSQNMSAPQVVAKGMNLIAQTIRELALDNGVPLLEAPPLARALYRHSDIGDQVPAALYTAVAEVMAYVYQLNQFMAGDGKLLAPQPPLSLPVPAAMDPGAREMAPQ
ncbi:MAG TPA: flagellar biosynthesis protein FlhB [Rhodocyclaceae bacterium]|nr:flagellar biosynthesis protein FlhB [Rhodocyclaceae bacterium]